MRRKISPESRSSACKGYTFRGPRTGAGGDPAYIPQLPHDLDNAYVTGPRKGERRTVRHKVRMGRHLSRATTPLGLATTPLGLG
jgi:hypothetical protein